jgi:hypothetical protein
VLLIGATLVSRLRGRRTLKDIFVIVETKMLKIKREGKEERKKLSE